MRKNQVKPKIKYDLYKKKRNYSDRQMNWRVLKEMRCDEWHKIMTMSLMFIYSVYCSSPRHPAEQWWQASLESQEGAEHRWYSSTSFSAAAGAAPDASFYNPPHSEMKPTVKLSD